MLSGLAASAAALAALAAPALADAKGKDDGKGKGNDKPKRKPRDGKAADRRKKGGTGPTGAEGRAKASTCQPRGTRCTPTTLCCPGLSCQGGTCAPVAPQAPTGTVGPQGATGPVGPQGSGGLNLVGPQGPQGPAGSAGSPGSSGAPGTPGAQGPAGTPGTPGTPGAPGATGPRGFQGTDGAPGGSGAAGPQGATGPQGAAGTAGTPGAQGATGPQGTVGTAGTPGAQGASGPQGFQGASGGTGAQGADGAQGTQGADGPQGFQGADGAAGGQGADGPQGFQGDLGPQGFQGDLGPQGFQGEAGPQFAVTGNQGAVLSSDGSGGLTSSPTFVHAYPGSGNVGVGVSSPQATLHVGGQDGTAGDVRIDGLALGATGATPTAARLLGVGPDGTLVVTNAVAPSGPTGAVQFNDGNTFFGGQAGLVYDYTGTGDQRLLVSGVGGNAARPVLTLQRPESATGPTMLVTTSGGSEEVRLTTSSGGNLALGYEAGEANGGYYNTGLGERTLVYNYGQSNTAIGAFVLWDNESGEANSALGVSSMSNNISGSENTAIGVSSLNRNETGSGNAALGRSALENTGGSRNTGVGTRALFSNQVGNESTAVGHNALQYARGSGNIGIGARAGGSLGFVGVDGGRNIAIGTDTGFPNLTGANQLVIGNLVYGTGLGATGATVSDGSIGIGVQAPAATLHVGTEGGQAGTIRADSLNSGATPATGRPVVADNDGTLVIGSPIAPSGPTGAVQFNDGNTTFGGQAGLVYDYTGTGNQRLLVSGVGGNSARPVLTLQRPASPTGPTMLVTTGGGFEEIRLTTSDGGNIGLGYQSGIRNGGYYNVGVGERTLVYNTGNSNTAVGAFALWDNETGEINSAFGVSTMANNISGSDNSAFGSTALGRNETGSENAAFGYSALENNLGGNRNTGVGTRALIGNQAGIDNVAVGHNALQYAGGSGNIGIGARAGTVLGYSATDGGRNIAIGADAELPDLTGANQLVIGNLIYGTGLGATGAVVSDGRVGIGVKAPAARLHTQSSSVTGAAAIFQGVAGQTGPQVLVTNAAGEELARVAAFGRETGGSPDEYSSLYIGLKAGEEAVYSWDDSYSNGNVGVGTYAMRATTTGSYNTAVGTSALRANTTGFNNVAVGGGALASSVDGDRNTAVGFQALPNDTGSYNAALGYRALLNNSSGSDNVAVGEQALLFNQDGAYNTAVGALALRTFLSGTYNTAVGYNALFTGSNDDYTNSTALGANATVDGSNQVQLGSVGTNTYVYGSVQTRSDLRDKADVRDTVLGLDFVRRLRPVDFRWDYREDYRPEAPVAPGPDATQAEQGAHAAALARWAAACQLGKLSHDGSKKRTRYHHGLIAQEVQALIAETGIDFGGFQDHAVNGGGDVLSLGYEELIAPLVKAVQELATENGDLRTRLASVEGALAALSARA